MILWRLRNWLLAVTITSMVTSRELAERMKSEIIADVNAGVVPAHVSSFQQLHDYVDAACYGGGDQLFSEIVTESNTDQEHQAKLDAFAAVRDPAVTTVDAWIKSGSLRSLRIPTKSL